MCKELYKETSIPHLITQIEDGYNEFKQELENDNQEKATEIAKSNDELRERLNELLKIEYDKSLLEPCDFEL